MLLQYRYLFLRLVVLCATNMVSTAAALMVMEIDVAVNEDEANQHCDSGTNSL